MRRALDMGLDAIFSDHVETMLVELNRPTTLDGG
jgi:hypothetical protein